MTEVTPDYTHEPFVFTHLLWRNPQDFILREERGHLDACLRAERLGLPHPAFESRYGSYPGLIPLWAFPTLKQEEASGFHFILEEDTRTPPPVNLGYSDASLHRGRDLRSVPRF